MLGIIEDIGVNLVKTDLVVEEIPRVYDMLIELFPDKPWLKRVADLDLHSKGNQLGIQLNRESYAIAYSLSDFEHQGMAMMGTGQEADLKVAMGLMMQVNHLAATAKDSKARSRFIGRVSGAFRNPDDMRALAFEMHVAVNLHRRGMAVFFPDECGGDETFDMLVTPPGGVPIEVECKTWSKDKGSPITRDSAASFLDRVFPKVASWPSAGEVLHVTLTVPDRLPTQHEAIEDLADRLAEAISSSQAIPEGPATVSFTQLSAPYLLSREHEAMHFAEVDVHLREVFGETDGQRVIAIKGPKAVAVEVRSARPSNKFTAIQKSAKSAIRKQMTGTRPGCLIIRMEGTSAAQLDRMLAVPMNPPSLFAEKLFSSDKHQHLACIVWMSDQELAQLTPWADTNQSAAYVMKRIGGAYEHLNLAETFAGDR